MENKYLKGKGITADSEVKKDNLIIGEKPEEKKPEEKEQTVFEKMVNGYLDVNVGEPSDRLKVTNHNYSKRKQTVEEEPTKPESNKVKKTTKSESKKKPKTPKKGSRKPFKWSKVFGPLLLLLGLSAVETGLKMNDLRDKLNDEDKRITEIENEVGIITEENVLEKLKSIIEEGNPSISEIDFLQVTRENSKQFIMSYVEDSQVKSADITDDKILSTLVDVALNKEIELPDGNVLNFNDINYKDLAIDYSDEGVQYFLNSENGKISIEDFSELLTPEAKQRLGIETSQEQTNEVSNGFVAPVDVDYSAINNEITNKVQGAEEKVKMYDVDADTITYIYEVQADDEIDR